MSVTTTRFYKSDKRCPNNIDQSLGVQDSEGIMKKSDLSDVEDKENNNTTTQRNDKFSKQNTPSDDRIMSNSSESNSNAIGGNESDDDERFHTLNGTLIC